MTRETVVGVPMSSPDITERERAAVASVLATPTLSIGPQVVAFEEAVARLVGSRHAVAMSSGTAGLHCAVIGAGVDDGSLVLTSPFSFVASANVILYERAVPVFADVDPATGNLDPVLACEAIDDLAHGGGRAERWLPPSLRGGRVGPLKAVLPVHAFGQPADLDPVLAACAGRGLPLIEDACEAIGATYNGRQAGTMGHSGVFAFYPNKQITTGEGGLLVTDDDELAVLARSLRNQGRDDTGGWLHHVRLGYNYRMDEMSAALGLVQVGRLDEILAKRAQVARWYTERLADVEAIEVPQVAASTSRMSWFVYVIRTRRAADRNRVVEQLRAEGIPSRPYFSPIHLQPFYRERFGYAEGAYPVCEDWGARAIAVPFSGVMTPDQVDIVCGALRRALGKD